VGLTVARTMTLATPTVTRRPPARDSRRTFRGVIVFLVLVVAAFAVWPVWWQSSSHRAVVATDLTELALAALAAFAALRRGVRTRRAGWFFLATALIAWLVGEAIWSWNEVVERRVAPISSAADVAFIASMVFALFGFIGLGFGVGSKTATGRLHRLTEAAVVATSLAFVFWETSLDTLIHDEAVPALDRALLLAYPIGAVAVVTAALVAVLNRRSRALELAALGAIAFAVADSLYSVHQGEATYQTGSVADLLWIAGLCLFLLAGLRPAMATTEALPSRRELAGRSLLGYGPTLAALAVGVWRLVQGSGYDGVRSGLIAAIAFAVLANQLTSYAENSALQRSLQVRLADLAKSEERFRLVVDDLAEAVVIVDGDAIITFASRRAGRMLDIAPPDLIGQHASKLVHPDDETKTLNAFANVLRHEQALGTLTVRMRRSDGSLMWLECDAVNLLDDPAVAGVVISVRDVTGRLESEAALAEARERFRAAFEYAPIGMALASLDGTMLEVNGSFARMLGYRPDQLEGHTASDFTHPEDWSLGSRDYTGLERDAAGAYRLEKRYLRADGRIMWASVSFSFVDQADGSQLVIGQVEDVTQRKAIAERLEYSARHDELTGLCNRSQFMDRLDRALLRIGDDGGRVAVMLLDLDRFKVVNDSLGHAAGDELLRVIAHRLQRGVRPIDTVARFGGDEFTVLMVDVPTDTEILAQADRLRRLVADAVPLADGDTYVSVSIGIALAERDGISGESIVQDADAAMYRAKERGRNRVERFDVTARASVVRRLRTGNDLHRALQRGEFRVEYQPVVSLAAGRVVGFEALARWEHPDRGMVSPSDFIDLAEETGLIVPIGSTIMRQAFDHVATWRRRSCPPAAAHVQVSVNLSARQLGTLGLVNSVAAAIADTGIDPDCVWLEITESALMTDAKTALVALRALRGIGVHLTVDDFGTGYSSLTYLQRFPVEGLKIDRSFVDGLGIESNDTTIVDTLIRLGHSLGLSVVAEGLETPLQLQHLRRLGCDNAQGFLFGRPMPAAVLDEDLEHWLDPQLASLPS
jgi:diguanylate cyclase (GGDEF)-like protein/PAS domain S-box-containing protein